MAEAAVTFTEEQQMTVIVEPDSLSAWLGLAGVGVGVLSTLGTAWLQARYGGRKEKHRELSNATAELLASAEGLRVIVAAFAASRNEPNAIRDWMPVIAGLVERVQKADAVIARLAQPALVKAAADLAGAARNFVQEYGGSGTKEALKTNIKDFSDASKNLKG
jgi:hypothetical protein